MMKMSEYKYILKKGEFDYIQSCLKLNGANAVVRHKSQTEYYFDTEDYALDKSGITCLVRDDGCALKGILKVYGNSKQDENMEIPLGTEGVPESFMLGELKLIFIGSLHTERKIYEFSEGLRLIFDTNTYLGERDFEMKLEFSEKKRREAAGLLRETELLVCQYRTMCGCEAVDKCCNISSKSGRFIGKKQSMKSSGKKVNIIIDFRD